MIRATQRPPLFAQSWLCQKAVLLFVISLQTDVGAVALFFKIRSPAYCIVLMFGENQKHNMCFGRELTQFLWFV